MQQDSMRHQLCRFKDRQHAGRLLAQRLSAYAGRPDGLVVALSRGDVPVGFSFAKDRHLPLDVMEVRQAWRDQFHLLKGSG